MTRLANIESSHRRLPSMLPLSQHTSRLHQGYGMTETSCVISMTAHGDATGGHVGGPTTCCEVKLVDIPDMNYTNADQPRPRGEVRPRLAVPGSRLRQPLPS